LHLAWIATPGEFWTSPLNLEWLKSGVALTQAFYAHGGRRAVGAGTCAEYTWADAPCNEETTPTQPATIYGRCKLAMALALAAAAGASAASSAWARLFFPYGPREPAGRLIPSVICGMLKGEPVACTHGRQVRDFIYVDDVASALVTLLLADAQGVYNVGSGAGLSLREVIGEIAAQIGRPELVRFGARAAPEADPAVVVADAGKLSRHTGWRPAVGIAEGIRRSIAAWRTCLAA
jgi:nucleoside-diphosphate-sugar epimerase